MEGGIAKPLELAKEQRREGSVGHESPQHRNIAVAVRRVEHDVNGGVGIDRIIPRTCIALAEDGVKIVCEEYEALIQLAAIERVIIADSVAELCFAVVEQRAHS